jgi:hypothetical protein
VVIVFRGLGIRPAFERRTDSLIESCLHRQKRVDLGLGLGLFQILDGRNSLGGG